MKLSNIQAPVIVKKLRHPAVLYIKFPSGDTWEYVIYDDRTMNDLLKRHGRNVGRLVSVLKDMNVEASKV